MTSKEIRKAFLDFCAGPAVGQIAADFSGIAAREGFSTEEGKRIAERFLPMDFARAAKDKDVILARWEDFDEAASRLETVGFQRRGDLGIPWREAFTRSPRLAFAHNLYVCRDGMPAVENHLKLRDFLRSHPYDAERYSARKFELAALHPGDVDAYCRGKTELIAEFLAAAGMDEATISEIEAVNLLDP